MTDTTGISTGVKMKLYWFAKPWVVTQAWGIFNPLYEKFGFSQHNGVDVLLGTDKGIYAPIDGIIVRTGNQPTGGGIFIGMMTEPQNFDDGQYRVLLDFLHCQELLKMEGDVVKIGDKIAIGDNTGQASSGNHTHIQPRRVSFWNQQVGNSLAFTLEDKNDANDSFDPSPYWGNIYAVDVPKTTLLYKALVEALTKLLNLLKK